MFESSSRTAPNERRVEGSDTGVGKPSGGERMIRIVSKSKRHYNDFGWLKTYWLFSFSNYFDPDNIQLELTAPHA